MVRAERDWEDGRPSGGLLVIPLSPELVDAGAAVLARAFARDAAWAAVLPDEAERRAVLPRVWRALVGYSLIYGCVLTTPSLDGVLCFLPPGEARVTAWRELRTGLRFARILLSLSRASRARFLRFWPRVDALRQSTVGRTHGYVWALGVEPDRRGQGVGGALLEAACARCAASDGLCALETEAPENVRFYERHAFCVIRTETIEPLGVHVWILARHLDKLSAHQQDP